MRASTSNGEGLDDLALPYTYADFNGNEAQETLSSARKRTTLTGLFSRGNDMESAHTSHTYTGRGAI